MRVATVSTLLLLLLLASALVDLAAAAQAQQQLKQPQLPPPKHQSSAPLPLHCFAFRSRRLVYLHIMKCGGLSVDALLKCRCASAGTPCALLREDGSARHASNASGDLVTRFRDSILYGASACAGGAVCSSAGVGSVPMDASGNAAANARLAAQLRVSRRDVGRRVTHEALLEAAYAPCAAQVLATHQSMASLAARPYWAGSHFVTVLREPVARVWSFYQYVRRKSIEFQDKPLLVFLERWRTFTPNATAASGGSSPHWHWREHRTPHRAPQPAPRTATRTAHRNPHRAPQPTPRTATCTGRTTCRKILPCAPRALTPY